MGPALALVFNTQGGSLALAFYLFPRILETKGRLWAMMGMMRGRGDSQRKNGNARRCRDCAFYVSSIAQQEQNKWTQLKLPGSKPAVSIASFQNLRLHFILFFTEKPFHIFVRKFLWSFSLMWRKDTRNEKKMKIFSLKKINCYRKFWYILMEIAGF